MKAFAASMVIALFCAGCASTPRQKVDLTKLSDEELIRRRAFLDDKIRDLEIEEQGSYSTERPGVGNAFATGWGRGARRHELGIYRELRTDVSVEIARREKEEAKP